MTGPAFHESCLTVIINPASVNLSINSASKELAISVSHSLNSNLSCISILPFSFKLLVFLFGGDSAAIPLL